ncbi:Sigma factor RpoE (sigma 24) [Legionella donaldsonii]|uniref:Sigma factor RpoE (Sigma 24) n=1 Tax=Legionella donaldsonii TaxID=45060 RepID=A0A378J5J3_9GAMM|nr:sigma-70 family RNA polymerase sigma factor [Legionella donaldsonii]STX42281.1 Sigma factor RpoE (sigma 24) [Legionella donaldsonii]
MRDAASVTERQLIESALKGEAKAMNHLIARYQAKIFGQIKSQISDNSIANDLTQEVSIKIFCNLSGFKQQANFTTWLYRITQNTIKNHFRAIHIESNNLLALRGEENNSPEAYLIGFQLAERVEKLFTAMSNELQHCFNLYVVKGLSYEDIAKHLDCPLGTVRSRIHRVRNILSELVN